MKKPCYYCAQMIDTRGMLSHVHFKHYIANARHVSREFSLNPAIWGWMWVTQGFLPPDLSTRALPASTKPSFPLPMLAPFEKRAEVDLNGDSHPRRANSRLLLPDEM